MDIFDFIYRHRKHLLINFRFFFFHLTFCKDYVSEGTNTIEPPSPGEYSIELFMRIQRQHRKEKYRSTVNAKNGNKKGELLPKKRRGPPDERHK